MAVYIDDFNAKFGRMIMCHLMADTTEELLEMVDKIGVQRKWIQCEGEPKEHFDISLAKKKLAIQHGAIEMNARKLVELIQQKKGKFY
jgi:hypothetical protein